MPKNLKKEQKHEDYSEEYVKPQQYSHFFRSFKTKKEWLKWLKQHLPRKYHPQKKSYAVVREVAEEVKFDYDEGKVKLLTYNHAATQTGKYWDMAAFNDQDMPVELKAPYAGVDQVPASDSELE